jgi:acetylornithine/N-succinyldiaminopimelate aminotransferase
VAAGCRALDSGAAGQRMAASTGRIAVSSGAVPMDNARPGIHRAPQDPMSHSSDLVDSARRTWLPVYRLREPVLARGLGARVWDCEDREYIDFSAGIAVNSLGHGDPDLLAALTDQAGRLWHASNVFLSEPAVHLAEELLAAAPFARRAFFCNSGAEANEAAIKLARRWASRQGRPPEQRVIVTFRGGFHGRTLATVTATAQPKYHAGFEPLPAGFRYCDFNDIDALDRALAPGDVCAVLVEPIQGEGGVLPAADGFLQALRARCDAHGALLMLDEIQCGMGRTGSLFAHTDSGVRPDAMSLAKALGCGMPIGALLVGETLQDVVEPGAHGTTFGGNPLACAVARVALRKLAAPDLLANVAARSAQLRAGLAAIDADGALFAEVRGRGLMLGAVLSPPLAGRAGDIVDLAAAEGLLLLQAGPDVLRFVPPLMLDEDTCREGLLRLQRALQRLAA